MTQFLSVFQAFSKNAENKKYEDLKIKKIAINREKMRRFKNNTYPVKARDNLLHETLKEFPVSESRLIFGRGRGSNEFTRAMLDLLF